MAHAFPVSITYKVVHPIVDDSEIWEEKKVPALNTSLVERMEPESDGFQVRNLLFQSLYFFR